MSGQELASLVLSVDTRPMDAATVSMGKAYDAAERLTAAEKRLAEAGNVASDKAKKQAMDYESFWQRALLKQEEALGRQIIAAQKNTEAYDRMQKAAERAAFAGIRSPQAVADELRSLAAARDAWEQAGKSAQGYSGAMAQITARTNVLTEGNARARGAIRETAAAMASLAFEAAGAAFLVTAVGGALAAPALFGVSMLKRVEDAQTGIAGILMSMGTLDGKALTFEQSMAASGEYVKKIQEDSLKFGIEMGKLVEVNQAAMSGGLAAMLTLDQIQKVATAGAIAVSSLGLNSQQYVQEVRDLIAGGIQPASSTLARSIGVTDALLKQWKAEGPAKLVGELTSRLEGFVLVADKVRASTLTGAWDILQARLAVLLSDQEGFGALKQVVIDVANYIGTFDINGKFSLNPELVATAQAYWSIIKSVGQVLVEIGGIVADLSPAITVVAQTVAVMLKEIGFMFKMIAGEIATIATQAVAVAHLDFKGAAAIGDAWTKQAAAARTELDRSTASILKAKDAAAKPLPAGSLIGAITGTPQVDEAAAKKAAAEADKAAKKAREEAIKANTDYVESQMKVGAEIDRESESLKKKIEQDQFEIASIGKTKEEIALLESTRYDHTTTMMREQLAILDSTNACTAESEALRENIKLRDQYKKVQIDKAAAIATNERIKEEKKAHEDMWKSIEGVAHDTWTRVWTEGSAAFTNIGKTIKSAILDMLYQMTVKKWIIGVSATASGGTASAADMASALGGGSGGVGSWLSAGKTIFEGFQSGFSSFMSAGSQLGQAVGYYGSTAMGASGATATTLGTVGSYAGAGLQGIALGSMVAGDKSLAGMGGTEWAAMGAIIGSFIPGLGTVLGGVIGGAIDAAFGRGPKTSGTTTLAGQFGAGGFSGNMQTPWSQSGGWFSSGRSGVDVSPLAASQAAALSALVAGSKSVYDNLLLASGEAQKSLAGWTFSINRQVATQEQANQLTVDMANSMGAHLIPSLSAFQAEGENLADTAVRMRDEFILTDSVLALVGGTFGAVGLASMGARDNLVTLMGGMQAMSGTMQSYYQNFFTDTERHAKDLAALTSQFSALGVATPTTAAGFRALVQAQDLSTQTGRQTFASLMSLNGAFAALIPNAQAAAQATNDVIAALRAQAGADMSTAAKSAADMRSFAASVRDLQRSLWAGSQAPGGAATTMQQFLSANTAAVGGDKTAQGNLSSITTGFLDTAKQQARTAEEYARSFSIVQATLASTASGIETSAAVGEAQVTLLDLISQTLASIEKATIAGDKATLTAMESNYAALASVQREITAAAQANTLSVDTLRGTVVSETAKQVSGVDTLNGSVLRITDPNGDLIGASNQIRTETIAAAKATSDVTSTISAGTNPVLESMNVWLDSINKQSAQQTSSLEYLLSAAIASNDAARLAVVDQSIAKLSSDIQAAIGTGYDASKLTTLRDTATGAAALSYAGQYATTSGTVSATGAISAVGTSVSAAQQAAAEQASAASAAKLAQEQALSEAVSYRDTELAKMESLIQTTMRYAQGLAPASEVDQARKDNQFQSAESLIQTTMRYAQGLATAADVDSLRGVAYSEITSQGMQMFGVPAFATGGFHTGGLRLVGENGPELEYTGPSTISSNADTRAMLSNKDVVDAINALREELHAGQIAISGAAQKTSKILDRWDGNGMPDLREAA